MNTGHASTPTYVTRLTSLAPSAISVIEIDGPAAFDVLHRCWQPTHASPIRINAVRFGRWQHIPASAIKTLAPSTMHTHDHQLTEDIVVCQTGDETLEVHCHGGRVAGDRILSQMVKLGAQERSQLEREEALTPDRWKRDALIDILKTVTPLTTQLMLAQARGSLSREMATLEAMVAHGNTGAALERIDILLQRFHYGKHLITPWKLAIVGPPNVGKSCLLNAIVGYERAIVNPMAGTTRDIVNECTSLLGWPMEMLDTAGLRSTSDYVEAEGVRRAIESMNRADLVLGLIDPTEGWTPVHEELRNSPLRKKIFVGTKADLRCAAPAIPDAISLIPISAQTGEGLDTLYRAIVRALVPESPQRNDAIPFRDEHEAYLLQLKDRAMNVPGH